MGCIVRSSDTDLAADNSVEVAGSIAAVVGCMDYAYRKDCGSLCCMGSGIEERFESLLAADID